MPAAPERLCAGTCGRTITTRRERCDRCARAVEQQRGSASARGYGSQWARWRRWFIAALVQQGIPPVCGARFPEGPQTTHSRCQTAGLWTGASDRGESLHLNHEPPLRDEERAYPHRVCDVRRIELLCAACHNALASSQWSANKEVIR
jgi:hypothetical protein